MTITESLISSFILVALTTQTGQLFGNSMQALGKGRLRDTINGAIHRDVENVRQIVASWKADTSMATNGQLTYWPDLTQCNDGTLATALLSDNTNTLPETHLLDLSETSTPFQGLQVRRTITTVDGNTNLIQVNYATQGSKTIHTERSATLSIPAQGWCPT